MGAVLSAVSIAIAIGAYVPYMRDILRGRVRPARSARIMFIVLLTVALLQQRALGSGWALAVTIGEAIGAVAILWVALKRGVGGLAKLDIVCYLLLAVDVAFWLATKNTFAALHLTVLADVIAFTPTLAKTWRQPDSETPIFYIAGTIAPLLSIIAGGDFRYSVLLFPLYLAIVNAAEAGLILFKKRTL